MKKLIGRGSSLFLLASGVYCLSVYIVNYFFYAKFSGTGQLLGAFEWGVLLLEGLLCFFSAALVIYSFKHSNVGRFNADIFITIVLFFTFMLSFAVPREISAYYADAGFVWHFDFISRTISDIFKSGMRIYEALFFLAMIAMGLTIGEK